MTDLVPFSNGEFELHITPHDIDGFHVWGPSLARALAFHSASDMLRSVPDGEKGSGVVQTPGGDQRVGYVTEAGFYRVLGQRQTARITNPTARAAAERFQSWVFGEVLPSLRRGEIAVARPAPLPAPAVDEEKAARVIATFHAAGIGDPEFWSAKAMQLAGRLLGESPQYDPKTRPLTVSIFLSQQGMSAADARRHAGTFGKALKAVYRTKYSADPPTIHDLVGRHMVPVAQYQEQHRPLFVEVWNSLGLTASNVVPFNGEAS